MQPSNPNPIRRLLVPLDGSPFAEQALPYARAIGGPDAKIQLLQVVPRGEAIYGMLGDQLVSDTEVEEASQLAAHKELERVRRERLGASPTVSIEIATGDYAGEILAAAQRSQSDLIVLATHGRGGLDRWIIGSVADRVARSSLIPVMLIQPKDSKAADLAARPIERLIVPLDGSELAAQALPFAGRIAAQLNVPVLLVRVSDLPKELSVATAYGAAFSPRVYEEVIAQGRGEALKSLVESESLLRDMGVTASHQVLEGQVAKAIANAAGENDLIVMTSHGHGGISRLLLGSVANQLINQRRLAVVLVPAVEKPQTKASN